ncbi:MAG: tryptophan--tRNA ligase [Candidatus Nanoarchaeia archaeon]|nr:tryptophan--tRNA ligase [Candidatus Nanoarchaeia archaeon]
MTSDFKVTPWETTGEVDYERLIKDFGVEKITDTLLKKIEKHAGELHYFLRRKIFFAHRDMNWLLEKYEKGEKFFLYTGRGPSGKTHLGHLVPYIFTKWIQDKFDVELYYQLTDDEKFLFKQDMSLEDTNSLAYENAKDFMALGFNPKKTHIIIDSEYSGKLYPQAIKVAKKLTFSTVKSVFGLNDSSNVGQIFFTTIQAVPAFLPSVLKGKNIPCLIPHAIDQDPHFRITRDILPKLGYYKPASIQSVFLPPLEGIAGKMSSSEGQAVYLTDSPNEVRKKIMKYAFSGGKDTVEEHRKKGGNTDIDISYQWLRFFEPDDRKLANIKEKYESGQMLTGEIKQILVDKINKFLEVLKKNREKAEKSVEKCILRD